MIGHRMVLALGLAAAASSVAEHLVQGIPVRPGLSLVRSRKAGKSRPFTSGYGKVHKKLNLEVQQAAEAKRHRRVERNLKLAANAKE